MQLTGLLKASGKTFVATMGVTSIGFISSILTARILGPEGRGLLSAAMLITTLAGVIAQLGLGNSLVYHAGAGHQLQYVRLVVWSLIATAGLSCLLALAGLQLGSAPKLHDQIVPILALAALAGVQFYLLTISQLDTDLRFYNMMRVGAAAGNFALLLLIVWLLHPLEYQHVVATQLVSGIAICAVGIYWWHQRSSWTGRNAGAVAEMGGVLQYACKFHGAVLVGVFLVNFDKLILLKLSAIEQYGFYALAFSTSRLIGALQDAISTTLFSHFAGGDSELLGQKVNKAFRLTLFPLLAVAVLAAAASPWFIVLIFGKEFAPVSPVFSVLLFECVIGGASWTLAQRFNAAGRPGSIFLRQVISVLPVLAVLPWLPTENMNLLLAAIMLISACLRLAAALLLFPLTLREPVPRMIPTLSDLKDIRKIFATVKS